MAKNRVVMTFSATPGGPFASLAGWSETFWRNVDQDPADLLLALTNNGAGASTIPLVFTRRFVLTPGWRIDGIKVYPLTGGRLANSYAFAGDVGKGAYVGGAGTLEQQPYDRLLWKMNCAGGFSRSCRIGGISSAIVDPGGNFVPDANFTNLFGPQFLTTLINNQFGMRKSTISDPYQIQLVSVDSTVIAGSSPRTPGLRFTGDVSAVFAAGKTVRISGSLTPTGLNGQWTVGSVAVVGGSTNAVLRAKRGVTIKGDFELGAYAKSVTYEVITMVSGVPIRGVSRKPGRPSGLPRGRRSRKTS